MTLKLRHNILYYSYFPKEQGRLQLNTWKLFLFSFAQTYEEYSVNDIRGQAGKSAHSLGARNELEKNTMLRQLRKGVN